MPLKVRGYTNAVTTKEVKRMRQLKAQGLTNTAIGGILGRSEGTISKHLRGRTYRRNENTETVKLSVLMALSEKNATLEVVVNGRVMATQIIPAKELTIDPFASFQANCERRKKIVDGYVQRAVKNLEGVLACFQIQVRFNSRMNHPQFKMGNIDFFYKKTA